MRSVRQLFLFMVTLLIWLRLVSELPQHSPLMGSLSTALNISLNASSHGSISRTFVSNPVDTELDAMHEYPHYFNTVCDQDTESIGCTLAVEYQRKMTVYLKNSKRNRSSSYITFQRGSDHSDVPSNQELD